MAENKPAARQPRLPIPTSKKAAPVSFEEAFRRFLGPKAAKGDPRCPVCRGNEWLVGPKPVSVAAGSGPGGAAMPLVTLTCSSCGLVRFFSAVLAGLEEES
jgi:hypothetical protein